ncbi:MAG TPA: protein kinase [Thermoanaerobaculia bacterium]|nr:protein kinase [Thermoanaerobaculia bacterium]
MKLGPYEIFAPLGSGGMGEVYRARDSKLDREVAVKVLPESLAQDPDALARFEGEAKAVAALSHPNILAIHDYGKDRGIAYAVMELLSGQTLRDRLNWGPITPKEAIDFGIQIARGLSAAHEKGIVHRDLKPENLFLTRGGHVKILDFGLAKTAEAAASAVSNAPTAAQATRPGTVLGTVGYMSPEQVKGEPVDFRSDIFSFGAVLYEMLAGHRAFQGDTAAETMTAILRETPTELAGSAGTFSPAIRQILRHCLEKSAESRFQSAKDVAFNLESAGEADGGIEKDPLRQEMDGGLSVAVLYLDNLSGAREDDYFRDGMTEDITTELAKIKSLRVFPRAAVASYRGRNASAPEVGEQLHATHVLGGSLRRSGNRLRVTVQIVETRTGHSVWAERYDRQLEDVFAVQEDVARSIAQALRITLSSQEDETIASKPTGNLHAYDYFLRGRSYSRQQRREFALEMFEHALALDPSFALAHAGIANVCAMQFYLQSHDQRWLERAVAASSRAFALDSQLPEAFVARARILYARGEFGESVEAARKAIALKHDCESSWDILGRALFASDRWEEAAGLVETAIEATGDDYNVYIPYTNVLEALGREAEATALRERHAAALERQLEWVPEDTRARMLLAGYYARSQKPQEAVRELQRVMAQGTSDPHTIYNAACTYGCLNMKEEALATLMRAVEAGYAEWAHLRRDPDLACLHGEKEFQELIQGR